MVSLKEMLQRRVVDRLVGWINWPTTEQMCRKAHGIELSFARCKKEPDWLRPTNGGKDWTSKVDWRAGDKVDPDGDGSAPSTDFSFEALDDEVKLKNERMALMAKAQAKVNEFAEAPRDCINDRTSK